MKRFTAIMVLLSLVFSLNAGCYGKFQITRDLYEWNGSFTSTAARSVVMWVFMIIPVYAAVGTVDFVLFNTIEFWTGSNPISMGPNDHEEKFVVKDGQTYKISAEKDRMDVSIVSGAQAGKSASLVYNAAEGAWYAEGANGSVKIAETRGKDVVQVFNPDGSSFVYNNQTGQTGRIVE